MAKELQYLKNFVFDKIRNMQMGLFEKVLKNVNAARGALLKMSINVEYVIEFALPFGYNI
jgi:hypothetical protein